jgi:drug/metabolite transporter (DMT)-like permease
MTPAVSMDSFTFAAVLAAAAMHAGWNAVLKVRLEPFLAMTLITGAAGIVGVPLLAVFGWPRAEAWPWLIGSVVLHLAYYVALTEAYRRADMGQLYPIARGGAPLLTASASLLILQEPISLQGALGVAFLGSGVALMSLRGARKHEPLDRAAIGFALATAVIICGYTLVDGIGARVAGDPHAYSAALFVIDGVPIILLALWRLGPAGLRPMMRFAKPGLAGGAMSLASYWIAIWAMTVAPIAMVAALRETSVLFAAVIAVVILKEPFGPIRATSAALMVAGMLVIRLQ